MPRIVAFLVEQFIQAAAGPEPVLDPRRLAVDLPAAAPLPGPASPDPDPRAPTRQQHAPNAPRTIKTSRLPIRPMSIQDAARRLEDSKNEFIVFRDTDTDRVSVMYKRRDSNLGLIAPEV